MEKELLHFVIKTRHSCLKRFKTEEVKAERPYAVKIIAPKQNMFWTIEVMKVAVSRLCQELGII